MAKYSLANEKSANNAWLDNTKRIKAKFALEKPVKGSKDSTRMSEKRAKEQAELQSKTDSVLREEMLAYKADDDFKKADKLKAELERREKLNKADVIEQRKARQALLVKAMKKIADDDLLNQIWALVPQSIKLEIAQSK
jgi:multidrug resistance efflux pump